jgi:hypothetical protein
MKLGRFQETFEWGSLHLPEDEGLLGQKVPQAIAVTQMAVVPAYDLVVAAVAAAAASADVAVEGPDIASIEFIHRMKALALLT